MKRTIKHLILTVAVILIGGCSQMSLQKTNIAESAEKVSPLKVGSIIPDVILSDVNGKPFVLKERLERPVILVFYRGGWCPYCNLQLAKLKDIQDDLHNMGFRIIAVSPDLPTHLKSTMERESLNYTLLSDSDMNAAKAFGIAFHVDDNTIEKYKDFNIDLELASGKAHHLLPVPSVFIIDRHGVVRFVYSNPDYKIRLSPNDLIAAAIKLDNENSK